MQQLHCYKNTLKQPSLATHVQIHIQNRTDFTEYIYEHQLIKLFKHTHKHINACMNPKHTLVTFFTLLYQIKCDTWSKTVFCQ